MNEVARLDVNKYTKQKNQDTEFLHGKNIVKEKRPHDLVPSKFSIMKIMGTPVPSEKILEVYDRWKEEP